jgi:4-hydroxybenzoate polyprenyltransferase
LAKLTLVLAVLLVALGLIGYIGTGSLHPTALIPAWIGLALGIFGFLAISPNERRRKLFMHINVTIALLGFLGTLGEIVRSLVGFEHAMDQARAVGMGSEAVSLGPNFAIAMTSKVTLAGLLLVYVLLCVRSFIAARRSGKV